MLFEFVTLYREEIIHRCRAKVATRSVPPPTAAEIDHGVPLFLDQLVDALRLGQSSSPEISQTALLHGHDLLLQGFHPVTGRARLRRRLSVRHRARRGNGRTDQHGRLWDAERLP